MEFIVYEVDSCDDHVLSKNDKFKYCSLKWGIRWNLCFLRLPFGFLSCNLLREFDSCASAQSLLRSNRLSSRWVASFDRFDRFPSLTDGLSPSLSARTHTQEALAAWPRQIYIFTCRNYRKLYPTYIFIFAHDGALHAAWVITGTSRATVGPRKSEPSRRAVGPHDYSNFPRASHRSSSRAIAATLQGPLGRGRPEQNHVTGLEHVSIKISWK